MLFEQPLFGHPHHFPRSPATVCVLDSRSDLRVFPDVSALQELFHVILGLAEIPRPHGALPEL